MKCPIYQVGMVRDASVSGNTVSCPKDAIGVIKALIGDRDREVFVCLYLNTRNRVVGAEIVTVGVLDASLVHPREVFKGAIIHSAKSIILAHNHPSGDTTPSKDDIGMTERMVEAGKLLGIEVMDHLIVADGTEQALSFKGEGLIE